MSNKRRWMMVGSLAMALALGHQAALVNQTHPSRAGLPVTDAAKQDRDDVFLKTIGTDDEEALWDALYEGKSLADVAQANGADPEQLIALQIEELKAQVTARFQSGSIDKTAYEAQLAEIPELIERSVYGEGLDANA